MKKLISITLLTICSVVAQAQNSDAPSILNLDGTNWKLGYKPLTSTAGNTIAQIYYGDDYNHKQFDTAKVIMLVCDTNTGTYSTMGYFNSAAQAVNDNRVAYYQYGFEVKKYIPSGWWEGDIQHGSYWEHFTWLDENKKPLSNSKIVWLSQSK